MTVTVDPTPTLAAALCRSTVDSIVDRTGLQEVAGPEAVDGRSPYRVLRSVMGPAPVGEMRVLRNGKGVAKAVYVGITVEAIGLDSHMVFAFTGADSAVPHFTLDSVHSSEFYAFHLDLIPRVELASHLSYVDACFTPLTETFESLREWDGLSRAHVGPRQVAMMSPWMCVNRATEDAFRQMPAVVATYRDHWFDLLEQGLPAEVVEDAADTDLAARDLRNRSSLFSADVDPVWGQIARLLGHEASEEIRLMLVDDEVPA
jgi:hypothetical protein